MEQRNEQASQLDSFHGFRRWKNESFDVKKKRKLQCEKLSFPAPKLPYWGPSFSCEGNFKFDRNPEEEEEEGSGITIVKEKPCMTDVNEISKEGVALDELQATYGHEEDLLEFGGHGNISTELQCCSDGAEGLLLPRESKQKHDFVLSSGRSKVNPEADSKTIKPTIDQEFEQYFSALMPSFDS